MRAGIDLGTTFSAIAYVNPRTKRPEIIKNRYGNKLTPSILAFAKGQIFYGEEAREQMEQGYVEVASFFKRNMGNDEYVFSTGDAWYTAKELSAMLLKEMVSDVRETTGEEVTEAVITVPAYFRHKERKATMEAAALAGIKVLHVINEPTAAALSYGLNGTDTPKTVLIYDLGGGTFDVAVAKITKNDIRILGSDGNHELGGKEWDDIIARYLSDLFSHEFGIELAEDDSETYHLLSVAETIKKRLSVATSAECIINYHGKTGRYTITNEKFKELSCNMLRITDQIVQRLLRSVGILGESLDGVLLVGGSTRMRMVKDYVEGMLHVPIIKGINVDEAVALGAAMKAYMEGESSKVLLPDLGEEEKRKRSYEFLIPGAKRLADTVSHSLGMISISADGQWYVNSIIIKKNTPIPACNSRSYRIATSLGENDMFVYLLQGEKGNPLDCDIVGKYVFSGIMPTETNEAVIQVSYSYNDNGMIEVSAMQEETGNLLPLTIEPVEEDMSWVRKMPKLSPEGKKVLPEGTLYLCVDLSGSMSGYPLLEAKKAISSFIMKLDINKLSIGIVGFADHSELILKPTKDLHRIEQALANMRVDGKRFGYGNTSNPFSVIIEDVGTKKNKLGKTYIVLLTDGVWTYKENAELEAKRCLKEEMEIVALGFGSADEKFLDKLVSKQEFVDLTSLQNLTQSFTRIAQIMTS